MTAYKDETDLPSPIQARLEGLRARLLEYKRLLRQYRTDERMVRELRMLATDAFLQEQRLRAKLEKALWNTVYDSPKYTAKDIKSYLKKVLNGLGLGNQS